MTFLAPIAEALPARASPVAPTMLVETVVSELHWSLVQVATLTFATDAALRDPARHPLEPWRHLLVEDRKPITLAMRYGSGLVLDRTLVELIEGTHIRWVAEKRRLRQIVESGNLGPKAALQKLASVSSSWRRLAADARLTLSGADILLFGLAEEYRDDARKIDGLLADAACGAEPRYNASGAVLLPNLAQKRRSPRVRVDLACEVIFGALVLKARLTDASRDGLGLACECRLRAGEKVEVRTPDGRRLKATVARNVAGHLGVTLGATLAAEDPLLAGAPA